jgi:hypothetical protein
MSDLLDRVSAEVFRRLKMVDDVEECSIEASGDPSAYPALNMKDGRLVPDHAAEMGSVYYDYILSIEGNVERGDGQFARQNRNQLRQNVLRSVFVDTDLCGLVEEIREGETRFGVAMLADKRRLSFETDVIIRFAEERRELILT